MKKMLPVEIICTLIFSLFAFELFGRAPLRHLDEGSTETNAYADIYRELVNLTPDTSRTAFVQNFTIQRDVATFNFAQGYFYFCKPVGGRIYAALFVGKGDFHFAPTQNIEAEQLARFSGKKTVTEPFSTVFMIFADSMLSNMKRANIQFERGFTPPQVSDYIRESLAYLVHDESKDLEYEIVKTLLDIESNGLFYAQLNGKNLGKLVFEINPYEEEEISLEVNGSSHSAEGKQTICKFHKLADYSKPAALSAEDKSIIHIPNYEINASITDELYIYASAKIDVISRKYQNWIFFELYENLAVDSVIRNDGSRARFIKESGSNYLWIECDPPLGKGENLGFNIFYHGKLIDEFGGKLLIQSARYWYPRYIGSGLSTYSIRFSTPDYYRFASIGTCVSSDYQHGRLISTWKTDSPVCYATFTIGNFRELNIKDERIPEIYVWQFHETKAGNNIREVGKHVANSLLFYQKLYGKPPVKSLHVAESPFAHGEAFPGIIHLTTNVFTNYQRGWNEIFIGHEVAHLWWGMGVDYKTYRDRWLAEAFAEYSGLWYMQVGMNETSLFFDILSSWRDQIVADKKYRIDKVKKYQAGPIWMGSRTIQANDAESFELVIYKKGAWVLHMLRNMMLDLETLDETRFQDMMKDYYATFYGKKRPLPIFSGWLRSI
ncbi:Peptidase M1 membrane alanine aminopeptidase [Chloroherpeton thalassium ATCC 35110]|uniref:Peptidase M1 membrane alanine aminopeptidase n=1 Tax=Chloroherpeton thalassium (strain ATCC 35110 / GB-78) TaxID=517418 RepID=B3QYL7_CHLT3|nr:M1 family aminopeptidase [Chloroherpeton thalassium]ACF13645.1 Peptidase M1 membrane alanine aminopeptidase [Chloroherpeton thalassium ATCC 35110]